ncbi:MAG: tetratricopeptide repeat protein [Spirulinaceae cyanobacterium RM2_2_10]|nr:tetratricopeptide repeat protein [Spirulinaceae cyanobacterium RM2_2_10]
MILVVFLGVPLLPLLSNVLRARQTPAGDPSTVLATRSTEEQTQLSERERGFELVLQREPDNEVALRGLVEVRLEQGSIASALVPLERLAERHPGQPDYGILLAQAREYLGDYEGAFQAYDVILTANPGDINALQGVVNLQLAQNRQEGAIGRLQDTLKIAAQANAANPGSIDVASVQLLLGQVYARQERYTEALAVYDQLITENTQDFRPVLAKATVLQQQSKVSAAKSLFDLAVSLAPAKYKDQIKQMAAELPDTPTVGDADAEPDLEATEPAATDSETEADLEAGISLPEVEDEGDRPADTDGSGR